MNEVKDLSILNDGVYNSTVDCTAGNNWKPENASNNAEVYGQGYFVGLVSGIMAVHACNLVDALKVVRQSKHFYGLSRNCIPDSWHSYFVFDGEKLIDLR